MESFFDFIFGNLFFVIIVIAAIFNFLNKSKQVEQDEQRKQAPERRTRTGNRPTQPEAEESRPRSLRERMEKALTDIENEWKQPEQEVKQAEPEQALQSIEEQRQAQYDRLRNQYQSATQDERFNTKEIETMQKKKHVKVEDKAIVSTHHKMTQQSLVDGVIMAEILGPPRALKPYQNVVQQRQQ